MNKYDMFWDAYERWMKEGYDSESATLEALRLVEKCWEEPTLPYISEPPEETVPPETASSGCKHLWEPSYTTGTASCKKCGVVTRPKRSEEKCDSSWHGRRGGFACQAARDEAPGRERQPA